MAIDEFKVKILAELDTSKINTAGSNFGKMASKHMEGVNGVSSKGGGMLSSMTQTLKGMTSGKGSDIAGSLAKHLGSKAPMLLKLGVIGGILLSVYNVLKSLAPIVGILKLVETVLKLTLYPIAQLLLTIFKPILYLLLKYVIIPLGSFFGLWKDPNKKTLGDLIGGDSGVGFIDAANQLGFDVGTWLQEQGAKFGEWIFGLGADFGTWIVKLGADFGRWMSETWTDIRMWWWNIKTGFSTFFSDIYTTFINIKSDILNISWSDITNKFNGIKSDITGISWSDITNIWINIKTGIVDIFNGIVDTINNIFAGIKWPSLPSWLGGGSKSTPSSSFGGGGGGARDTYTIPAPGGTKIIRKYATGGIAMTPQIASIAEKGPEVFLPLDKLRNLVGGGSNTITINIAKIEKEVDIDSLVNKLERILYSNNKRSGAF